MPSAETRPLTQSFYYLSVVMHSCPSQITSGLNFVPTPHKRFAEADCEFVHYIVAFVAALPNLPALLVRGYSFITIYPEFMR